MSDLTKLIGSLTPHKRALLAKLLSAANEANKLVVQEPIAIIGLSCRFPGAKSADDFWQLLKDGVDAISEVPGQRWNIDAYYDPDPTVAGKISSRWGGFIENVELFDADFFGITPREAVSMDPQQRLLLEIAWESLEDAGQTSKKLAGSKTGVFVGISNSDYSWFQYTDPARIDGYTASGTGCSIAANRLSYVLDLRGPSMSIDTACSSSLVAVHLACQSLRARESNLALAGGVMLMLSPLSTMAFSRMGTMAADGRCKTFDARADGYVRGEGCGVVVLKRLSDALADGDPIRALILGSAVNQDGRTTRLMAPSMISQSHVVGEALKNASVEPAQVSYIEAHGTGTALGDPIEVEALTEVFGQARDDQRCVLGAVKSNIGHLEAAAGIAGLIKVVLSMEQQQIPASLHLEQVNPHISLEQTPFVISTKLQPWTAKDERRLAGMNSFGAGGTNAHVVVEEAPAAVVETETEIDADKRYLLPLSARAGGALRELAQRYVKYLGEEETRVRVQDLCYTAGVRRAHHPHRLCVVGHDYQELQGGLQSYVAEEAAVGVYSGRKSVGQRPKVAFIFPGQGSQWLGMGRELLQREAVFRRKLEECEAAMRPYQQWSLIEELQEGKEDGEQQRIDVVQPQLFALQVGLAELWRSWGVEPDAVVGHSMGEVAAACVSGVLSLEAGAQVICQRSQLLRRLSGRGAMAVVELSAGAVAGALGSEGGLVSVAAVNSWRTTVISGERAAIKRLVEKFGNENIYSREVKVDVASHSREVEEISGELREQLAGLRGRRGAVAMYSTVTGAELKGEEVDGEYWVRNVREEVRFAAVLEELKRRGYGVYVEVSAHPVLLPAIEEVVRGAEENGAGGGAVVVGTLRKEMSERQALLESVGQLYASGVEVDWEPVNGSGRCVKLPSYPWQRQRYWIEGVGPQPTTQPDSGPQIADWLYEIEWQRATPVEIGAHADAAQAIERYLILTDREGVGEQLAEQLRAAELEPVLVYAGEKYEQQSATVYEVDPLAAEDLARVLQAVSAADLRIVHLWSLDVQSAACSSAAELLAWQQRSCGSVLHLVQALGRSESAAEQRLWVVTSGAQALGETGEIEAAQAAVWGLGRVVGHEQPQQWGGLIDLDGGSSAAESAAQVLKELRGQGDAGAENEVGYRGGERYVPRLVRARTAEPAAATPLQISGTGSYLITGGMGGLGLEVGKWLVSQGARHVVLLGRSGPKESATEAIETMQAAGAMVECVQADVADTSRMREVIEEIEQAGKELRGVIHAAGVLDDGVLSGQTWERFERVMNSKVLGAWNLAELTREKELDFFVLFSSGASILGSPGQGNYAAANAYLDSLAAARQRRGEVGLSINWGAWAEVGLAAREDRARLVASRGIQSMKPAEALMALGQALDQRRQGQIALMAADWVQFLAHLPGGATPRILLEIAKDKPNEEKIRKAQQFRRQLEAAPPAKRKELMLTHLRSLVVQVMGFEPSHVIDVRRGFFEMGMDSLMIIDLKNRIQFSLGLTVPATVIFDYATTEALAEYLTDQLLKSHSNENETTTEAVAVADESNQIAKLLNEMKGLSNDELLRLLEQ